MKEFTLYIGHGSRDADGNQEFLEFIETVRSQAGDSHVETCFLELASPTIPEGIEACVRQGATHIIVVPVILLAATHVKLEIPEFIDAARERYPHVAFIYGRNIGLHEKMIDLLSDRFAEMVADPIHDETAIVLMGRGSSDPDANGDVYKIARQIWERTHVLTVEVCFTGITTPRLPEGVKRAVALGAKQVIVVPYFLFTGVLIKRMRDTLAALQADMPEVTMRMAEYFGKHPVLIDVVVDRRREAMLGQAFMNCDLCQYRKLAHHEHEHNHEHNHEHTPHPVSGVGM